MAFFRHGARTPLHPLPGTEPARWDNTALCASRLPEERAIRLTAIGGGDPPTSPANEKQVGPALRPWQRLNIRGREEMV